MLPVAATDDDRLIAMWLHGRPATTQAVYRKAWSELAASAQKPLQQITLADVQAFHNTQLHLAAATQARKLSSIKSLLTFAHKAGYIQFNPGVAIQMPKVKNTVAERIIAEDDVHRMIELETNQRDKLILRLLYMCGLRREEVTRLSVKDMRRHGKGGKLTVFGKGNKTRIIPIPAKLWNDLEAFASSDREAPLFPTAHGRMDKTTVWRIVKRAAKRSGLPESVAPHHLRHSHASHSLDNGCPVHVLQVVLGHASIATTSRYLHVNANDSSADYLQDG